MPGKGPNGFILDCGPPSVTRAAEATHPAGPHALTETSGGVVDVTRLIDDGPITALLVRVAILCGTILFLVGLDTASINVAAPLIAEKLSLSQAHLGPIFSAALLGSLAGALSFGALADRFGRKRMLEAATLNIAVYTLATPRADSFPILLKISYLAGIGLGGATPCLITLASEYAPAARRATVTSLIWTAFPLGVISGSFLNALLLQRFGWQSIFLLGGLFPLLVLVLLLVWLPESVRFLLTHDRDPAQVRRIVSRIAPDLPADARIVAVEERVQGAPLGNLFRRGRALQTTVLWVSCFSVFGTGLGVFFWTPMLMHDHGTSLARASVTLGLSGIGALLSSAVAGRLINRFGVTAVLVPAFLAGALTTAALGYAAGSPVLMTVDLIVNAALVGGIASSGVLATASGLYPTAMRSTGLGWATSMGRLGELLSPLLTGGLIALGWTLSQVFLLTGLPLLVAATCVLLLGWRTTPAPVLGKTTA